MYMWPKEIQQIIAEVFHAKNPICGFNSGYILFIQ